MKQSKPVVAGRKPQLPGTKLARPNKPPVSPPPAPSAQTAAEERSARERAFVWLLTLLAAVRVFVYCAVFPFFNNVDEVFHFDLVVKYSHGDVPRHLVPISQQSARAIFLYGTPEYLSGPGKFPDGRISPPTWTYPPNDVARAMPVALGNWRNEINHEATEPPLYYAIAALWLRLGRLLGLSGGFLLYWIRFLNPLVAGAIVWIGFIAARQACPERPFVRLGVASLLAFFPQDIFYSIQSDVLSPVFFGLAFIGIVKWLKSDASPPGLGLAAWTGGALAAAGLVKSANWPLVAVALVAVAAHAVLSARRRPRVGVALPSAVLAATAVVPLGGWILRNTLVGAGPSGSAEKIRYLGWTRKPLADWWHHPLFTPRGLGEFWSELMASFWRGEFVWFGQRLASPVMDAFYWISSLVLVGAAAVSLLGKRHAALPSERPAIGLALASFVASVGFLAVISLAFDFGACVYPSRAHPFFTSGRLMSGALVPFALLYVYGLDRAGARLAGGWLAPAVLAAVLFFVTLSEIELNSPAFASAYNWFGLFSGPSAP